MRWVKNVAEGDKKCVTKFQSENLKEFDGLLYLSIDGRTVLHVEFVIRFLGLKFFVDFKNQRLK